MRFILMTALLFGACRADKKRPHQVSTVDRATNKIHGVWESILIKSREKLPPKKITLKFTTYNKTKLVWMQMISMGPQGKKFDKTIQVNFETKNGHKYIVPSVSKQLEDATADDRFIRYDPRHIEAVKGLAWKYILTEDRLTIEMDGSIVILRRLK